MRHYFGHPGRVRSDDRRALRASIFGVLVLLGACDAPPPMVELWIEPPDVYRFGSEDAVPLELPDDLNEKVQVLAAALREATAETEAPDRIAVFAPYTGTRLVEPEYTLLRQAACEAGIREIDLSLTDPYDPDAPLRTYDAEAAAPNPPPLCGALPVISKPAQEIERREFLPDPPE
jgi:hypothetical protein